MNTTKATICVLGAGVLWGCISLFVRALDAAGISSFEISAIRMGIGALGMLLFLLVTDRSKLRIRLRDIGIFVCTGVVSVFLFNVCYFVCITLSEASIAVVLLYTSPAWVMLMSAVFFRERITRRKLVALFLTLSGCVLVAGVFGGSAHLTLVAMLFGAASGLFYASYSIFGRIALQRYDAMTVTFYTLAFAFLGSLCGSDLGHIVGQLALDPLMGLWYLGLGICCTMIPYVLYTTGLKHLETSRAAILATVEPVVGGLLGIFAYGESTDPLKLLGMACILGAVFLANSNAGDTRKPGGSPRVRGELDV